MTLVRAHLKRARGLAEQNRIGEAFAENAEAQRLCDAICPGDDAILASVHHQRGFIYGQEQEHAAAGEEYRTAMHLFERIGETNGAAYMRCNAADCYYRDGNTAMAAQLMHVSWAIHHRRLSDNPVIYPDKLA